MIDIKQSDNMKINITQCVRNFNNKYLYCVLQLSQYVFNDYTYEELCNIIQFDVSKKLMNPDNNISKNNVWVYDNNSKELLLVYDNNGYPIQSLYIDIDALIILTSCTNLSDSTKREFSIEVLKDFYTEPDTEYTRILNSVSMVREYRVRASAMQFLLETDNEFRYILNTTGRLSNNAIDKIDKIINDRIFGSSVNKIASNYTFNASRIYEYCDPQIIALKCAFLRAVSILVYNTKIHGANNILKEVRLMEPYVLNGINEYINERINNINCMNTINSNMESPFEFF